ncbi:collagen-like repeat preface domain-containing protein, partial [Bacillus sp. D-CC]
MHFTSTNIHLYKNLNKKGWLAIIKNLITILKNPTFVASAVFIELQNLINFLLSITKLFRIDPCTLQELLKLIAALQTALVNS